MPAHRRGGGNRPPPPGSDSSVWGWFAVVAVIVVLVVSGIGALYYKSRQAHVATDPETLCPIDRPITDVLAILVDASDVLTEVQRIDILNRLERKRAQLPQFGLLEVYVLSSDDATLLHPILSICNPGNGDGMNQWYQSPEIALRHWNKEFKSKIDAVLTEAISHPDSSTSPIFEAIHSVSLFSFGAVSRDHASHKLLIVSDLLQNVPGKYSQYQGSLDFPAFSQTAYYTSVRSDLQSASVDVLYLTRPANKAIQGRKHIDFWEQFFKAQGAELSQVDQIFGAQ